MSRHNEYNTLTFCAFRYALGRKSYIVADVCHILCKNADKIDPYNRELMIKEIKKAIADGHAGMDCHVAEWQHVLRVFNEGKND